MASSAPAPGNKEEKDHWTTEAYQNAASFVPKLATKIVQWLDPQKDDRILDIGCGDGVLDIEFAEIVSQGQGHLHGVDSSPALVQAAQKATREKGVEGKATFEVLDANELISKAGELQSQRFNKAFSNAAMHWILRPAEKREGFFRGVREALAPGAVFAFEMGGLGNVSEIRAALLMAAGRRIGLDRAQAVDPWFFPDEVWIRDIMEQQVGGWRVDRIEREWRPTTADVGGVVAWVRIMAAQFIEALPEAERESFVKEVVDVLEIVCAKPGGGFMYSYVRLRVLATRI
ncbi:S-adenosyl-L-methionine-dependent methyltransferase [Lasiosphaeria miniovina]|uniref:S-adenosyl-L-methionine-dependent methyltransferase n=1 Tax=Lasiosphaeria miniovina TaxID=1954250 RepID=A0AA40BIN0_9PEZI|nr:S-adenosyl-L-methionine-dependent methyltransferase [Lasiosphaeria miniovina]KAK0734910.1 S-adenosyl-L-methionine-dependent methyltransferase [Lasiosphaeria miniovina]